MCVVKEINSSFEDTTSKGKNWKIFLRKISSVLFILSFWEKVKKKKVKSLGKVARHLIVNATPWEPMTLVIKFGCKFNHCFTLLQVFFFFCYLDAYVINLKRQDIWTYTWLSYISYLSNMNGSFVSCLDHQWLHT